MNNIARVTTITILVWYSNCENWNYWPLYIMHSKFRKHRCGIGCGCGCGAATR